MLLHNFATMPISFFSPASLKNTFLTIDILFWNKAHEVSTHQELGCYLPLTSSGNRRVDLGDNYLSCNPVGSLLGLSSHCAGATPEMQHRCNQQSFCHHLAALAIDVCKVNKGAWTKNKPLLYHCHLRTQQMQS